MALPKENLPAFPQSVGFFIMLPPAYHHTVKVYQPSLKLVFIYIYIDTPHPAHALLLDDMRWVYNTYTSDRYFSDLSCKIYRVYCLCQDFCIYKSGFLNFHSNNYRSSFLPCPSQQTYYICHVCEWVNTLGFLQECRLYICWNDPGPANICRSFWYSWTAGEDLGGE